MGNKSSGSAEGDGASTGLPIPGSLQDLAEQVKAVRSIVEDVDTLGERSIVGEIDNLTRRTLSFRDPQHDSGGFTSSLPPNTIAAHTHGLFGSKNTAPLRGTVGKLTYEADDGAQLICAWSNPFVGTNMIEFSLVGRHWARYACQATVGGGNTGAHMRWVLFELPGPYSVREFLQERGVNRVRAIEAISGNTLRTVMGL
jgi:hypothetical protein